MFKAVNLKQLVRVLYKIKIKKTAVIRFTHFHEFHGAFMEMSHQ